MVTFRGRPVEKILIEGDDLFEDQYSILSRNFNASAVSKIQAIDKYVENLLLKGIENSDRVVLNITMEEDVKNKFSGDVSAGASINGFYGFNTNLFSIGRKFKMAAVGHYNNTGTSHYEADQFTDRTIDFFENRSRNFYNASEVNLPSVGSERFKRARINFSTLSAIFPISKTIKTKVSLFHNYNKTNAAEDDFSSVNFIGSPGWESQFKTLGQHRYNTVFSRIETNIKLTDSSALNTIVSFSRQQSQFIFSQLASLSFIDTLAEETNNHSENFSLVSTYSNRISSRSAIQVEGIFINTNMPLESTIQSDRFHSFFNVGESFQKVKNSELIRSNFLSAEGKFLTSRGKHRLSAIAGFQRVQINAFNSLNLFSTDSILQTGIAYSNNHQNTSSTVSFSVEDALETRRWKIKGKIGIMNLFYTQEDFGINSFHQPIFYITPGFSLHYISRRKGTFLFSYNRNTKAPVITDLIPGYYLGNYSGFSKGSDKYSAINRNTVIVNYNYFNFIKQVEVNISLFTTFSDKEYGYQMAISPQISKSEKTIFDGNKSLNGNITLTTLLLALKSTLKVGLRFSNFIFYSKINSTLVSKNLTNLSGGSISLASGFKGIFNATVRVDYNKNILKIIRSKQAVSVNEFDQFIFVSILKLNATPSIFVVVQNNYSKFYKQPFVNFLDASISINPGKWKIGLSIDAKNLFNMGRYVVSKASSIEQSVLTYSVLPRYFLAGINFRF